MVYLGVWWLIILGYWVFQVVDRRAVFRGGYGTLDRDSIMGSTKES